ncbi:MAG: hypothetical protein Q9171_002059 [Xanthocarpia ochracea]
MYLQANPGRGRTQQEQDELRNKYKPGEQVLPRVTIDKADVADERMLAEVREMSLRDASVPSSGSYERGTRHRTAERRLNTSREGEQGRRHQQRHPDPERSEANPRRQIGHQSSLRSLMSSSEIDSSEMEEEIVRLVDEGWLDGIDLNNLDTSQVDELSERIAEAYRRRHGQRERREITPTNSSSRSRDHSERHPREHATNHNNRRSADAEQRQTVSHPPISRPRLLEAYPTSASQQRRASSEHRRQTSPSPRSSAGRISSASQHQASRSTTDLSERPSSLAPRPTPAALPTQTRRTTNPGHIHTARTVGPPRSEPTNSEQSAPVRSADPTRPVAEGAPSRPTLPPRASDPGQTHPAQPVDPSENSSHSHEAPSAAQAVPHPSASALDTPKLHIEPSVTCNSALEASITFARGATVWEEDASIGMASGMQRSRGWRKCPNGHRMIVIGFEDCSAGQRRVIVKDLVGGLGLKTAGDSNHHSTGQELSWQDGQQHHIRRVFGQETFNETEDSGTTASPLLRNYPASGGLGMRALAVWSYWPEEDATDELSFPRGAEIREVEDINGDWSLGSYSGKIGLFPSNHVRVLDVVKV